MHLKGHELQNLSIVERISLLLLNNDLSTSHLNRGIYEAGLSALEDNEFDVFVDQILGYGNLPKIENERKHKEPARSALGKAKWSAQSASDGFSSSYRNIKAILKASGMQDGDTFVDIGSGYGRVGCVVGANFPNSRFLGYEIVPERVIEAQRIAELLELNKLSYFCKDVSADDFTLPVADWFFLYDSLNDKTLAHILKKICHTKGNRNARLIAKYTGNLNRYSKSPYLELISKTEVKDCFGKCWFYRFK